MCQQGAGWLVPPSAVFARGRKTGRYRERKPGAAATGRTTSRCVGELLHAAADVTPAASVSRPGRIAGLSVTMLSTSVSTPPHSYALLVTAGLEDVAAASIAELLPGLTIRVLLC